MTSFFIEHQKPYGLDAEFYELMDAFLLLLSKELNNMGFKHLANDENLLLNKVHEEKLPGFSFNVTDTFVTVTLKEKCNSFVLAREKAFEVLSILITFFEKLSIYVKEYASYDDKEFYLSSVKNNTHFDIVNAHINEEEVIINISKDIYNVLANSYISPLLNPFDLALCVLDNKRGEVNKIIHEIKKSYRLFYNDTDYKSQVENLTSSGLPFYFQVSLSLAKKKMIRFISLLDNTSEDIYLSDLKSFLEKKTNVYKRKLYKINQIEYFNYIQNIKSMFLCLKCVKDIKDNDIKKPFTQKLILTNCEKCNDQNTLEYLLFPKNNA